MAKEDIVEYQFGKRTAEEQQQISKQGGIASGEARREKATMRKTLEKMLNATNSKGNKYSDNIALGLIANAIDKKKGGNPEAYKVIAKMLGELEEKETMEFKEPVLNITINNEDRLKEAFYEKEEQE